MNPLPDSLELPAYAKGCRECASLGFVPTRFYCLDKQGALDTWWWRCASCSPTAFARFRKVFRKIIGKKVHQTLVYEKDRS